MYCEVDFDDGSFSNDLLPEDIKVNFLLILEPFVNMLNNNTDILRESKICICVFCQSLEMVKLKKKLLICFRQNYNVLDGAPPVGTKVDVIWLDNLVYEGVFRGTNSVLYYMVSQKNTYLMPEI